jgi:hypothetical protein
MVGKLKNREVDDQQPNKLTIFEIPCIFYVGRCTPGLDGWQRLAGDPLCRPGLGGFATHDVRDPLLTIVRSSNAQNGF